MKKVTNGVAVWWVIRASYADVPWYYIRSFHPHHPYAMVDCVAGGHPGEATKYSRREAFRVMRRLIIRNAQEKDGYTNFQVMRITKGK